MSEYTQKGSQGNSVGIVEKKVHTTAEPPGELELECGQTLGPITLAYETYGTLNTEKSNAVLILHALSGDAHVAGVHSADDEKPGWWDSMVGPGKGIDTDRYFVVCSNIIGSCMGSTGPCSINPKTVMPYGLEFPVVTIGDMVRAQKSLIEALGIRRLLAVVGGSVGGMQVLEWCTRYPDMVAAAIPLATTTRHSALAIAFNEVARQAIMADPNWNKGDYYFAERPETGLAVARMIGHVTYLSDESMRLKFGRRLQDKSDFSFSFDPEFQVESYLRYQGKRFVERFDANAFLYITKAADYFDLAEQHGDGSMIEAFSRTKAHFLIISFTSDRLYQNYESREMVKAIKKAGKDVSFLEIEAEWGHDAFLIPNPRLSGIIGGFLSRVFNETAR